MSNPQDRMCAACQSPFHWTGVEKDGVEYCCEACAAGRECTCTEHEHLQSGAPLGSRSGDSILGATTGEL